MMDHIVIAEDEEAIRKYLKILLERSGYQVSEASDGLQALNIIRDCAAKNETPDLLLTDLNMPKMSGFELLDNLQKEKIEMPAMVVTGSEERKSVVDALRKGCVDFIDKPIKKVELIKRVGEVIKKVENNEENRFRTGRHSAFTNDSLGSIGVYKLLTILGEGSIGTVYLCEDEKTKKRYALKTVREPVSIEKFKRISAIKRFVNESNAISQIKHPNIVNFIELGYQDEDKSSDPYIVMEYFNGYSLRKFMSKHEALELKQKIKIIRQICEALAVVHEKGIYHRDIKPDNILINDSLHVKVTDFGICHLPSSDLTKTSELMGSPKYMAPEYLQDGKQGKLMDIYALGVITYELLLGVNAVEASTLNELLTKMVKRNPVEPRKLFPDFPVPLQNIIAKMLKKNPKKRYQDTSEILIDLDRFERGPNTSFFLEKLKSRLLYHDWD